MLQLFIGYRRRLTLWRPLARWLRCLVPAPVASLALLAAVVHAAETPQPGVAKGKDWRVSVRQFAEQHLKHPAWGLSHSERDYQLARTLAADDHVILDDDVLYAAAYLHDVAAFAPFEKPGVDHADEGAQVVAALLDGTGFPMTKIEAVRGAIRTHMFDRKPTGAEAVYLHDADALDWLGAIGVARIFALVDPNGGAPDGPAALKMLEDNLKNVPPGIVSKAGRAMSVVRVRELEKFLSDLRRETAGYRTL
jgi:uncharacterized protein